MPLIVAALIVVNAQMPSTLHMLIVVLLLMPPATCNSNYSRIVFTIAMPGHRCWN